MKKTNIFKSLAVAAALLFTAQSANAQLEQSVFLNAGMPLGQFHQKLNTTPMPTVFGKENIAKETTIGFGLGYRAGFVFDIGYGEVTPFLSADLLWNQTSSKYRDQSATLGYKIPNYFNIPILIGVNYRYGITDIITAFGEFGVGYDAFFITPEGKKGTLDPYAKYKTGGALAWQVGVGSYFGNHFSVGIHYYGLGKHTINYKKQANLPDLGSTNELRSLGSLNLRIGFHF
ncbi:MAG: porin family protein [Bacteroidales bacterium]|nr:porin family protein [Bacteroidales bacterium]